MLESLHLPTNSMSRYESRIYSVVLYGASYNDMAELQHYSSWRLYRVESSGFHRLYVNGWFIIPRNLITSLMISLSDCIIEILPGINLHDLQNIAIKGLGPIYTAGTLPEYLSFFYPLEYLNRHDVVVLPENIELLLTLEYVNEAYCAPMA